MLHLLLQPDYTILSKYIQFPYSATEMQQQNPQGYPIAMDWFYTDELYEKLEKDFKALLDNHRLSDHYDNLMLISLSELQRLESTMMAINTDNRYRTGLKELAKLLIAFEENKELTLLIRPASAPTVKVTDNNLALWIGKLVKETLENGNYKYSDLGFEVDTLLESNSISFDKVKEASKVKLNDPSKEKRKLVAEFCIFILLPYLNAETYLKKEEGTNFSDDQLRFLHELLVVLELFSERIFDKARDYEPKDYMRNYLMKYAKGLIKNGNHVKKK